MQTHNSFYPIVDLWPNKTVGMSENLGGQQIICSFWVETLCHGQKNSEANFCFLREKWLFFRPKGEKTIFLEGNKCSSQSFFDPGRKPWDVNETPRNIISFEREKNVPMTAIIFLGGEELPPPHPVSYGPSKNTSLTWRHFFNVMTLLPWNLGSRE